MKEQRNIEMSGLPPSLLSTETVLPCLSINTMDVYIIYPEQVNYTTHPNKLPWCIFMPF